MKTEKLQCLEVIQRPRGREESLLGATRPDLGSGSATLSGKTCQEADDLLTLQLEKPAVTQ